MSALKVQHDDESKVMLELEVAVTVSKGQRGTPLALGGVCSQGVFNATPDANSALTVSILK